MLKSKQEMRKSVKKEAAQLTEAYCKDAVSYTHLYYPYRLWQERIRKNVRPVFMVYSNSIFRLLEYAFSDICDYSSIRLVREKRYSLEDVEISREDLLRVFRQTRPQPEPKVTFIQADSFPKVISLVEHLQEKAMTTGEIAELFGFRPRQSDYYYNCLLYTSRCV